MNDISKQIWSVIGTLFGFVCLIVSLIAIPFAAVSGASWLICWLFNLSFSWRACVGIYVGLALVFAAVKIATKD